MNRERSWEWRCVGWLRWGRRAAYGLVLAVLVLAGWLHQVGLPGFLKVPLVARLEERGVSLAFDRVRLRLTRGIVAEGVSLGGGVQGKGLRFFADDVQVRLGWAGLLGGRVPEVKALLVRGGRLEIPVGNPGEEGQERLVLDRVTARLGWAGSDVWRMEEVSAQGMRGTFLAHGTLAHMGAWLARMRRSEPSQGGGSERWRGVLRDVMRWMDATRFDQAPECTLAFDLDLLEPALGTVDWRWMATGASNEVLRADFFEVGLRMGPGAVPAEGGLSRAEFRATTRGLTSRWLDAGTLVATATTDVDVVGGRLGRMAWKLEGSDFGNRVGRAGRVRVDGVSEERALGPGVEAPWTVPPQRGRWAMEKPGGAGFRTRLSMEMTDGRGAWGTNLAGMGSLVLDLRLEHSIRGWREAWMDGGMTGLRTSWTGLEGVVWEVGMTPNSRPPPTDASWEFLWPLAHCDAWGRLDALGMDLPKVSLDGMGASWTWMAPWLEVGPFEARWEGGVVEGEGEMDVSRRRATATARSDADPRRIAPWLAPAARAQLANYAWPSHRPPRFRGSVGIELPRWSGFDRATREATLANLTLDAELDVEALAFRDMGFDRVTGRVTYTNRTWRIGPLELVRPEGRGWLWYENDERTRDYHSRFRSGFWPSLVAPVLDDKGREALGRLEMGEPPAIEGEAWGRWGSPERLGIRAHVQARRAVVRGEPIEWAEGDVTFTNRVISFTNVRARSDGDAWVPGAAYDTSTKLLSFTNAQATVPVERVTRIIGPRTAATMAPYRFKVPPRSLVDGVVNVGGADGTDIRFDIEAEEFSWWKLRATQVRAGVRLVGETLRIERLRSGFYGGQLGGDLYFDWSGPQSDAAYKLDLGLTNVVLRDFLTDAWPGTNRLEGVVSGHGRVTSARTGNPATVNGEGLISMRDGYLWGLPVFGLFSPLLDTISPGLGQTRFTSGRATYVMTNGLIRTRDLEMRSAAMRLGYGGSVDLGGKLDATMQAELFRDAPVLGRLISLALSPVTKLFEYEVRGTLGHPLAEPRYIPRFLMVLLKPTAVLREILTGSGGERGKTGP